MGGCKWHWVVLSQPIMVLVCACHSWKTRKEPFIHKHLQSEFVRQVMTWTLYTSMNHFLSDLSPPQSKRRVLFIGSKEENNVVSEFDHERVNMHGCWYSPRKVSPDTFDPVWGSEQRFRHQQSKRSISIKGMMCVDRNRFTSICYPFFKGKINRDGGAVSSSSSQAAFKLKWKFVHDGLSPLIFMPASQRWTCIFQDCQKCDFVRACMKPGERNEWKNGMVGAELMCPATVNPSPWVSVTPSFLKGTMAVFGKKWLKCETWHRSWGS